MAPTFQQAVKAWQDLDFSGLQRTLDEQAVKINSNQEFSLENRKTLSAKTKDFKRLDEEERLGQIKALLKLYQGEIDNLTNRCKYSESCFMNAYKLLADAPDPLAVMESSVENQQAQSEVAQLRTKNQELTERLSKLADYDNLKSQINNLEVQLERTVAEQVEAKEKEVNAAWDEKFRAWESKQIEHEEQEKELKSHLAIAQAQISTQANVDPTETNLRLAELNTTARELEKATFKIVQLENRNVQLRKEVESAKSSRGETDLRQKYEAKLAQLESENALIAAQTDVVRNQLNIQIQEEASRAKRAEQQAASLRESFTALQSTLALQQDYDQIKKELEVLRSIEFGNDDNPGPADDYGKVLETKNRQLGEELTSLRVQYQKLRNENDALKQSLQALEAQSSQSRNLVKQLESDLSTMHRDETFSQISGWTAAPRRASPASSIAAARAPPPHPGPSSDVLGIITQQRDRFKEQAILLEEEVHRSRQSAAAAQKELEAIKQDNVDLYERTRYLRKLESEPDRYRGAYEEGLTSFQLFKNLETERAMASMGPVNRVFFAFFREAVLHAKVRYGAAAYVSLLHVAILSLVLH